MTSLLLTCGCCCWYLLGLVDMKSLSSADSCPSWLISMLLSINIIRNSASLVPAMALSPWTVNDWLIQSYSNIHSAHTLSHTAVLCLCLLLTLCLTVLSQLRSQTLKCCVLSLPVLDSSLACSGPRPTESQGQGHGHQLITVSSTVTGVIVTLSLGHMPSHPKLRSNSQSESMTPYTLLKIKRWVCRSYFIRLINIFIWSTF